MATPQKWTTKTRNKTYYAWRSMRSRCNNPNDASFQNYGARGIRVCPEWQDDFDAFLRDMGEAPEGLSLDRIDGSKGYEKSNCRWADWTTQLRNRRTARLITHDGLTMNLSAWAERLGIAPDTLHHRLERMSPARALTSENLKTKWDHGTRTGYDKGCRCPECRAFNAQRARLQRERKVLR